MERIRNKLSLWRFNLGANALFKLNFGSRLFVRLRRYIFIMGPYCFSRDNMFSERVDVSHCFYVISVPLLSQVKLCQRSISLTPPSTFYNIRLQTHLPYFSTLSYTQQQISVIVYVIATVWFVQWHRIGANYGAKFSSKNLFLSFCFKFDWTRLWGSIHFYVCSVYFV